MIQKIEETLKSGWDFKRKIPHRKNVIDKRWLENPDNLSCYQELFFLPYGDPRRKNLKRYN